MKPKDVLPDEKNSVEKDGIIIRKGTLGAFTANIKMIETSDSKTAQEEAVRDLLELVPALIKLEFFEHYAIKSQKVREILRQKFPALPV